MVEDAPKLENSLGVLIMENTPRISPKSLPSTGLTRTLRASRFIFLVIILISLHTVFFLPTSAVDNSTVDLANPVVKNSHIIIIPNEIVIEVLSFNESGYFPQLIIELPENAKLINISGSLNYSSVKTEGNNLLLQNASVTAGSHLAIEYAIRGEVFSKKITMEIRRLLILIPATYGIPERSDNLVYRGKAILGQNNYSIFEANNLTQGDEILLRFKREPVLPAERGDNSNNLNSFNNLNNLNNPAFLGGILLITAGVFIFIFSKRGGKWRIGEHEEKEMKEMKDERDKEKRNEKPEGKGKKGKKEKEEKKEKKKTKWEI